MKSRETSAGDLTTFVGVALVRKGRGRGLETFIVPDLSSARQLGLSKGEMKVVRAGLKELAGQPAGACTRQKQNGSIRCIQGTCTGSCHLFRAKIPIDPESPKIEDLGETDRNWVEMEKGYGYWCDCV
jgi:hypothetical protein